VHLTITIHDSAEVNLELLIGKQ